MTEEYRSPTTGLANKDISTVDQALLSNICYELESIVSYLRILCKIKIKEQEK